MNIEIIGKQFTGLLLPLAASLLIFLSGGCAKDKHPIVFTDDGTLPHLPANAVSPPKMINLGKADETKIDLEVFSYLLTRHFWDDGGYTAIFLQADDSEVKVLQKKYYDHTPPIKPGYRADLHPNRVPVDKDTGKAAMILSVDVNEPEPDGTVSAIGKWYAGGAVTGFYSFILKKTGDDWEIQNPP